ncbi:MAG TPA: hypothetical protein VGM62_03605 [Chthoniobacterales bacterium]|jgi:hypothetical protein
MKRSYLRDPITVANFVLAAILMALFFFAAASLFAGSNEPINIDTKTHQVKKPPVSTAAECDLNFAGVDVCGLANALSVSFVVDGTGQELTVGSKNPVKIPAGGSLKAWTLMGKPTGTVTIDILRAADGAGLPVTSIIGAATKPALSATVENASANFAGWTSTTLNANDNLAISLSGVTDTTYCVLTLYYK